MYFVCTTHKHTHTNNDQRWTGRHRWSCCLPCLFKGSVGWNEQNCQMPSYINALLVTKPKTTKLILTDSVKWSVILIFFQVYEWFNCGRQRGTPLNYNLYVQMIGQIPKNVVLIVFSEIPDYLSPLFWDQIDTPACIALLQRMDPHIAHISD